MAAAAADALRQRSNGETQALRAYIEAKKRAVRAAEARFDIPDAAAALQALARPLLTTTSSDSDSSFPASWKQLYLDAFYRDVAAFVLGFGAVHLELCFSLQQRADAFDAFFDVSRVPATSVLDVLTTTLAHTTALGSGDARQDDAKATIAQCVRLLEVAIDARALEAAVTELLALQDAAPDGRRLVAHQPLVASLCALPDVVHNRCERAAPSCFRPHHYFPHLCASLFRSLLAHYRGRNGAPTRLRPAAVFRLVADKLVRIGQSRAVVDAWLTSALCDADAASVHQLLLESLSESAYAPVVLALASASGSAVQSPVYRLVSLLPLRVVASPQFQYVVAHKLLLAKPVSNLYFVRVLTDALAAQRSDATDAMAPLAAVFDVVVQRWSAPAFAVTADYALNASVTFFLRYALQRFAATPAPTQGRFSDWVPQLCHGVQCHMSHSLERVRVLGMRVGESVSHVLSPDKPLDFDLQGDDPLAVYGSDAFDGAAAPAVEVRGADDLVASVQRLHVDASRERSGQRRRHAKAAAAPMRFALDPDEVVDSDSDATSGTDEARDDADGSGDDSDSDMSLEAYDLRDDEQDLTAKRPVYLKDLVTSLSADDKREETEAALAAAEALLRRAPRDVHENAVSVVTALLRLEDKYSTPNFVAMRANALAAACAVAPAHVVPYFQAQALEREQLLQSRIDVLHAMATAAQELARVGAFQAPRATSLLREDMETETTRALKTRRWGYRRDPLAVPTKNAFAEFALAFFSPLLVGYVAYVRKHAVGARATTSSEIESVFLAHLLHALGVFVECAGHAPQAIPMAKCLLDFAWRERAHGTAAVRRQVLFSLSRVLLVVPPVVLRQDLSEPLAAMLAWLERVRREDADEGCRDGARLLLASSSHALSALLATS